MKGWIERLMRDERRREALWREMRSGRRTGGSPSLAQDIEPDLADALRGSPGRMARWSERIADGWNAEPLKLQARGTELEVLHYLRSEVLEALLRLEEAKDPGRPWSLADVRASLRTVRRELIESMASRAGTERQLAASTAEHPGDGDAILSERQRNAEAAKVWRKKIEAQMAVAGRDMSMPRPHRSDLSRPGRKIRDTRRDKRDADRVREKIRAQVRLLETRSPQKASR